MPKIYSVWIHDKDLEEHQRVWSSSQTAQKQVIDEAHKKGHQTLNAFGREAPTNITGWCELLNKSEKWKDDT